MWQLINHTPYKAERAFVRDKNGAEVWLVAVKGTYTIKPDGTTELADEQAEVCLAPEYNGEAGQSSLKYESDLIHTKIGTDVIMNGHAYAPAGKPMPHVDVMMKFAGRVKTLRAFGDRFWRRGIAGLKLTSPEPFTKMPIIYERAFGGTDQNSNNSKKHGWESRNPIGRGFAMQSEHLIDRPAANIENPKKVISSWKQRPQPAGFGVIAAHWSPRMELAGTYDDKWQQDRQPLLPLDFDDRYYQCAPEDQQIPGFWKGGEQIELYNLSANGVLRFSLPRVWLVFSTSFGKESIDHRAKLHTVILEPDFPRVIMVWHTSLLCHNKEHKLEQTLIREKDFI